MADDSIEAKLSLNIEELVASLQTASAAWNTSFTKMAESTHAHTEATHEAHDSTDKLKEAMEALVRQMGFASSGFTSVGGAIKGAARSMESLGEFAAIAGIFAVVAEGAHLLFENLEQAAESATELINTSRAFGITVEGLQGVEIAAGAAGQGMGVVERGARMLTQKMTEARGENKKVAAELAAVGISAQDLADPTFKAFQAMSKLGEAGLSLDDSLKLFGTRIGAAVLPVINNMKGGLDEATKAAIDNGAITTEQAEVLHGYHAQMNLVNEQLKFFSEAMAADMAPAMEGIIVYFKEVVQNLWAFLSGITEAISATGAFDAILLTIEAAFIALNLALKTFYTVALTVFGAIAYPIGIIVDGVKTLIAFVVSLVQHLRTMTHPWDAFKAAASDANQVFNGYVDEWGKSLSKLYDKITGIWDGAKKGAKGGKGGEAGQGKGGGGEGGAAEAGKIAEMEAHQAVLKDTLKTVEAMASTYQKGSAERISLEQTAAELIKDITGTSEADRIKAEYRVTEEKKASMENALKLMEAQGASAAKGSAEAVEAAERESTLVGQIHGRSSAEYIKALDKVTKARDAQLEQQIKMIGLVSDNEEKGSQTRVDLAEAELSITKQLAGVTAEQLMAADRKVTAARKEQALKRTEVADKEAEDYYEAVNNGYELATIAMEGANKRGEVSEKELVAFRRQMITAQLNAEVAKYEKMEEIDAAYPDKVMESQRKIEAAKRKSALEMAKIDEQLLDKEAEEWKKFTSTVSNAMGNMITGIITHTNNWKKSMTSIFNEVYKAFLKSQVTDPIANFATGLAKQLADYTKHKLAEQSLDNVSLSKFLASLVKHTTATEGAEAAETAATTTAAATQGATDASASIAGMTAAATAARVQIAAWAPVAAAAAFAATAAIPYVGPGLAPAAAAASMAEVYAFEGAVPGFSGGGVVDSDTLAKLHTDEMVLPSSLSKGMQQMIARGGDDPASRSVGAPSGSSAYNINISAMDGKSVEKLLMQHGSKIVKSLHNQVRNFNTPVHGKK